MRIITPDRVEKLRDGDDVLERQTFYPYTSMAYARRMLDERNPAVNSSGSTSYYPAYNHEFLQDGKSRYTVERFLGAGNYDSDPDSVLGYWAVRVRWISVVYSMRIALPLMYSDPGDAVFRLDIWLLDQYFDYTAVTWNNPPAYTGAHAVVTVTANAYNSGLASVCSGRVLFDTIPTADDGYPIAVYGIAATVTRVSGDSRYYLMPSTGGSSVSRLAQAGRETDPAYYGEYLPL